MASPLSRPTADLALCQELAEAVRRVAALNREVATLQQEVAGYRIVLQQAVHQLHALNLKAHPGVAA